MKRIKVSKLEKGQRVRVVSDTGETSYEGIVEHAAEPGLKARVAVEGMYPTCVRGYDNRMVDGPAEPGTRFFRPTSYDKVYLIG